MLKICLKEKNVFALALYQVVVGAVWDESNLLKGKSNICTE